MERDRFVLSRRQLFERGAKGAAGLALARTVFEAPTNAQAAANPNRDNYWNSFQESFTNVQPEEVSKFIKDPEGNIRTRVKIAEKMDEIVPLMGAREFHNLSKDQIQEDMNMYFDMYWAGWEKYQVPWYALWVIHIQESTVSRDINADRNGDGAMQVIRGNMGMPGIKDAPEGYRELQEKTQRFSTRGGKRTTDSDEILRGAAYIRLFANKKGYEDDFESVMSVIAHNYSAEVYGQQRVRKIRQLHTVLTQE